MATVQLESVANAAVAASAVVKPKRRGRPAGSGGGKGSRGPRKETMPKPIVPEGGFKEAIIIDASLFGLPKEDDFTDILFHRETAVTWHKSRAAWFEGEVTRLKGLTPQQRMASKYADKLKASTKSAVARVLECDDEQSITDSIAAFDRMKAELLAKLAEKQAKQQASGG